jgi:hypothetical protein
MKKSLEEASYYFSFFLKSNFDFKISGWNLYYLEKYYIVFVLLDSVTKAIPTAIKKIPRAIPKYIIVVCFLLFNGSNICQKLVFKMLSC